MDFRGKRALVAGGAGFIGSHLVKRLLSLGVEVSVIDNFDFFTGANDFNLDKLKNFIELYRSDIVDMDLMCEIVQGKDYIFNLAGRSGHARSMSEPFADLLANTKATLSLLEACSKCNRSARVIFASTRQIYGCPHYLPVDEAHPLLPVDVNGIHKLAAEQYHNVYMKSYGINYVILRLTNTYGPCMRIKDAEQNFLGVWLRKILEGKPLEVWGGEQLRDFTYVEDCVDAFLLATDDAAMGKTYNLSGPGPISLRDLAQQLANMGNRDGKGSLSVQGFPEERKKIDIGSVFSDDSAIRMELGWLPKVSLTDGLAMTLSFYEENMRHYV